ncbi:MAG: aminopeptidase P N-terminal domain-containing protein [Rhodocyclaceae bacterium]|nr:aminopeptidase P N-terminal domain-containing protein [Rhodocyclaceae bacterium]
MNPFKSRRERLLTHMTKMGEGMAIIPTASEKMRNRDTAYPYRADSYFHYLTGFPEPEAVLVLIAGDSPRSLLFCREKDPAKEVWDGFRFGPDAARETFGIDEAHSIKTLDEKLPELIANQPALWFSMGHDAAWDTRLMTAVNAVRALARKGTRTPASIHDVRHILDEMRLIKDDHEIALMRRAADISANAFRRAQSLIAPGRFEYEIEAELLYEFCKSGRHHPAYPPIVASGPNACVLHYVTHDRCMKAGDLVLIDAGCEVEGYAADITRTFPVGGPLIGAQKEVVDLVAAAQKAAIATLRPGRAFHDSHDAAVRVLSQGMIDLGLLNGSLDGVIESEAYKRFYMHRTGHWLGLDVHDAGLYREETRDAGKILVPGMTLTVEPGCYIRPADDIPRAFHNIGVRIEDDVLVTPTGCEILTKV